MVFYNWLIGNMGVAGDYIYQSIHWRTLAAVIFAVAAILVLGFFLRKKPGASRRLLVAVSVFQLAFEILWRLIYFFIKGDAIQWLWPMYPCNLGGILVPIFALAGCKTGKKMFYLFGFVGGVLTFAMPDGIFSNNIFVFPILKSVLQHTGLLLIPALEYIYGTYRPTLKDMGWVIGGCLIHVVNCEGIDLYGRLYVLPQRPALRDPRGAPVYYIVCLRCACFCSLELPQRHQGLPGIFEKP